MSVVRPDRQASKAAIWKLLSLLLQYPDRELLAARAGLLRLARQLPPARPAGRLVAFLEWTLQVGELELQQQFVATFDFDRRAALELSFHTHGDRRDRGLEMLKLKRRYADAGFPLKGDALPDSLPAMLELAALSPQLGEAVLREHRPGIELVRSRLRERASSYAPLLDAICEALPQLTRGERAELDRLAAEGPPRELVGLAPFGSAAS